MSNKVTVAAIQMTYGLEEACERSAKRISGAQIILLPNCLKTGISVRKKLRELPFSDNTRGKSGGPRDAGHSRDFKVVIPVSYYERVGETTFNTVAVIDADGTIMGQYRKTHIPDDHFIRKVLFYARRYWLQGLGYGFMRKSASVSGTSGSRSPRAAWHAGC